MIINSESRKKHLYIVAMVVLVDMLGFAMIVPLVALYGKNFGASFYELAILGSSYSFFQLLFASLWGKLSDRIGRRPVLLFSLFGSTLSHAIFGLSQSFAMLLFARSLSGVFAANIATAHAAAADLTDESNRLSSMGVLGASIGLGFTIGPAFGGLSAYYLGLAWPGFLASLICGINLLLAFKFLPETHHCASSEEPPGEKNTNSSSGSQDSSRASSFVWSLPAIYFLCICAFSHMEQVFALSLQSKLLIDVQLASLKAGQLMLIMGLVSIAFQGYLVRKLAPLFGETTIFYFGLTGAILGMLAFTLSGSFVQLAWSAVIIAGGTALLMPALTALIAKAHPQRRGQAFGINQSAGSLARIIGPFSGLYVFGLSAILPFWIAMALYFSAGILALPVFQKLNKKFSAS